VTARRLIAAAEVTCRAGLVVVVVVIVVVVSELAS
jgi:hypothetical protein